MMITLDTPKLNELGFSMFRKKRYKHKLMAGKCVKCGLERPGGCECVAIRQYTYNQIREDYQQHCTESRMEEVAEAVQKAMCTAFMLGDKLLNERPLMPSWDVASHSASMPRRRVFFDKMKMKYPYVRTKK